MINLLPTSTKQETLFARRNSQLAKWAMAIFISILGGILIMLSGQIYLNQSAKAYSKRIQDGQQQLKDQKLEETEARVSAMSSNIKLVIQVLSREILFSKLLKQVGAAVPSGAVLTDLTINKVEGGIDLTFESKDYQTGSQIALNLQDPTNKIFDKADLVEIKCSNTVPDGQTYPCTVTIRALFGDNSPYLFINTGKKQ